MLRKLLLIFAALSIGTAAQALAPRYQEVLQPRLRQEAVVENATFAWDALHFQLASGRLALGGAEGTLTTAAFRGRGQLDVAPPNPIARQQMQFLLGKPAIAVSFTEAIFRFASARQFERVLGTSVHFRPAGALPQLAAIVSERAQTVVQRGLMGAARQLLALDSPQHDAPGWFLAALKTGSGWMIARFDPLDGEAVEVSQFLQNSAFGTQVFQNVWAHFPGITQAALAPGSVAPLPAPDQLADYNIKVVIPSNLDMAAQTAFTVTARRPGRGLLLQLDPDLRVTSARLADGSPVDALQPPDPGREPAPFYTGNWVYLELPHSLAAGQQAHLSLQYHGKNVIQKVGNGNFFAQSTGWYPQNLYGPPFQRARYHLEFENQDRYTLIATGVRQSERKAHGTEDSVWTTPVPLTVAGFALGDYSTLSKPVKLPDGQTVTVNVFTNNSPDDLLASINTANQFGSMGAAGVDQQAPLAMGTLNTRNLAPAALAQVSAALQFMTALYGPYPYKSLSVVPIPYPYGQGWPGLLYLSDLSFLDSTQLEALGAPQAAMSQLSDTFRAHETSHQWWGHRVGWASYHDQWLSEGFANASALFFQMAADGESAGLQTLEQWRQQLQSKGRMGHVHGQDGALWLGQRLSSSLDPNGYQIVTYDKGGYVLYMLREMMLDTRAKHPNAAFIAMMKDFTSTYASRDASTADFQQIVEKHMLPSMDIEHNHSMNWFFRKYVYGTGIPQLTFHASWAPDGAHTKLTLTIANPGDWQGLLPVYIWQGKRYSRGQLRITQPQETVAIDLGFKPTKVEANQFLDMLVDVRQ
ncbi:MAG: M1 family aminopeptidase [Terriglobales bacterium]